MSIRETYIHLSLTEEMIVKVEKTKRVMFDPAANEVFDYLRRELENYRVTTQYLLGSINGAIPARSPQDRSGLFSLIIKEHTSYIDHIAPATCKDTTFSIKQSTELLHQTTAILDNIKSIICNTQLVDYVGVNSQFDYSSIMVLLKGSLDLIDLILFLMTKHLPLVRGIKVWEEKRVQSIKHLGVFEMKSSNAI